MPYEIQPAETIPEEFNKTRMAWPFTRMRLGEKVFITDARDWDSACKACHVTGSRKGFRFRTRWDAKHRDEEGTLRPRGTIWRVL